MLRVAIFLCLIAGAIALELQIGPCPIIPKQYVDLTKTGGRWYMNQHSSNIADNSSKCQTLYINPPEYGVSKIIFSDISTLTNNKTTIVIESQVENGAITTKMHIPGFGISERLCYILETDNINYAVNVACEEYGNYHLFQVFANTRLPKLPPSMNMTSIVNKAMKRKNLTPVAMTNVDHSQCSYQ